MSSTRTVQVGDDLLSRAMAAYFPGESQSSIRNEDRLARADEGLDNYRPGGYHHVYRGQLYEGRYMILSKLGWGHFSTVWLAADLHTFKEGPIRCRHIALKIQKGDASYLEAAIDEVKLLSRVTSLSASLALPSSSIPVVQILDSFRISSPHGQHMITAFPVLGENLLQLLARCPSKRLPIASVKLIARDVLLGLDFLHRHCHIIHTDLKPENVLVASDEIAAAVALATGKPPNPLDDDHGRLPGSDREGVQDPSPVVRIADLGNACWTDHHFSDYITTRQYRSPEIILKAEYGSATDIWSLGCLCFELLTGEYLFDPQANRAEGYSRNDDHLALMMELMGPCPAPLLATSLGSKYFDQVGRLSRLPSLDHWPLHDVLHEKHGFRQGEAQEMAGFLGPMLALDPARRVTAQDHLAHPWIRCSRPDSVVVNMQRGTHDGHRDGGIPSRLAKTRRSMVVPRLLGLASSPPRDWRTADRVHRRQLEG